MKPEIYNIMITHQGQQRYDLNFLSKLIHLYAFLFSLWKVGYVYRENSRMPGYYDGRYWTLWKLPMFGCSDSSQVLNEIHECKKAYPNAYIRCLAFDNQQQVQCMAFVIQKPITTSTWKKKAFSKLLSLYIIF